MFHPELRPLQFRHCPDPCLCLRPLRKPRGWDATAGVKRPAEIGASDYKDAQDVADGGAASAAEPSRVADALLVSKEDIFCFFGGSVSSSLWCTSTMVLVWIDSDLWRVVSMIMAPGMEDGIFPLSQNGKHAASLVCPGL